MLCLEKMIIIIPMPLYLSICQRKDMRQKSRVLKHQVNDLTFDMYGKEMTEILPSHSV